MWFWTSESKTKLIAFEPVTVCLVWPMLSPTVIENIFFQYPWGKQSNSLACFSILE